MLVFVPGVSHLVDTNFVAFALKDIDADIEKISATVALEQEKIKAPSGKYVYQPEVDLGYGSYRVDEYETPCEEGFNPPICFGYKIVFKNHLGDKYQLATGKLEDVATDNAWVENTNFSSTTLETL